MKFCPNCGAPKQNEQDTRCPSCGLEYPVLVQPGTANPSQEAAPSPAPGTAAPATDDPLATAPVEWDDEPGSQQDELLEALAALQGDAAQAEKPAGQNAVVSLFELEELAFGTDLQDAPPPAPSATEQQAGMQPPIGDTAGFATSGGVDETPPAPSAVDKIRERAMQAEDIADLPPAAPASLFAEEPVAQRGYRDEETTIFAPVKGNRDGGQQRQAAATGRVPQQRPRQEEKWQKLQGPRGESDGPGGLPEPPDLPLPPAKEEKPRKKRSGGRVFLFVLLGLVIFVLGVSGTTLGMLYFGNNSAKAVSTFSENLAAGDTTALSSSVRVTGATPSEAGFEALCAAFTDPARRTALEADLLARADGSAEGEFSAITLDSEPLFLFVRRYFVRVNGVELALPGEDTDGVLYLNGAAQAGSYQNGGMFYTGIMPGLYTYVVNRPEGAAMPAEVLLLEATNTLEVWLDIASITVQNCITDDAQLYVNGEAVDVRPIGGNVTLTGVKVGSTIRIVALQEGQEREATVVFSDINNTTLRFENYSGEGPQPDIGTDPASNPVGYAASMTVADVSPALEQFYLAYLDCINAQAMEAARNVTAAYLPKLEERVKNDYNASNTFEYVSATITGELTAGEDAGRPALSFDARFEYKYTPRDGSAETANGSNTQTVQLVYEDGEWRVNDMERVSN